MQLYTNPPQVQLKFQSRLVQALNLATEVRPLPGNIYINCMGNTCLHEVACMCVSLAGGPN